MKRCATGRSAKAAARPPARVLETVHAPATGGRPEASNRIRGESLPAISVARLVTRSQLASSARNMTTPTSGPSISTGPWRNCPPSRLKQGMRESSVRPSAMASATPCIARPDVTIARTAAKCSTAGDISGASAVSMIRSAGAISSPSACNTAAWSASVTVSDRVAAKASSDPPAPTSVGARRASEDPPSIVRPNTSPAAWPPSNQRSTSALSPDCDVISTVQPDRGSGLSSCSERGSATASMPSAR